LKQSKTSRHILETRGGPKNICPGGEKKQAAHNYSIMALYSYLGNCDSIIPQGLGSCCAWSLLPFPCLQESSQSEH
jgi:hypothetical protein